MQNSVLYIFCYKLELFGVKRSMKHKHKWLNKTVCFSFLKKLKLYTKSPPETVFLSNLFVASCISSSSTKEFFTKERHIDGSLVK